MHTSRWKKTTQPLSSATDAAAATCERRRFVRKVFPPDPWKNNNNNGDTASCLCNSSARVYVINDHVYVFFPHALYACNLLIYNNNVHINILYIYIQRRNARPVNINHVTRSRTIIRSAAALLRTTTTTMIRGMENHFFFPAHISLVESGKTYSSDPHRHCRIYPARLRRHCCGGSALYGTPTNLQSYIIFPFIIRELSTLFRVPTYIFRHAYYNDITIVTACKQNGLFERGKKMRFPKFKRNCNFYQSVLLLNNN